MNSAEWLAQTNQILDSVEGLLSPEYMHQLQVFQRTLILSYRQEGALEPLIRNALDHAIASDPFRKIWSDEPDENPYIRSTPHWSERVFNDGVADPNSSTFYDLRDVFQVAHEMTPDQIAGEVKHVLDQRNVVDYSKDEDSPLRNRPAYLDDPKERFQHAVAMARPLTKIDPATPKDWDAKATPPPAKDWSVLGR